MTILVNQAFSQSINHWETIIKTGNLCKYLIPASDIGTDWTENNFDDSG